MNYVKDLELASKWYCAKLGFSIGDYDYHDFVELQLDGHYIMHLFRSTDSRPAEKATFVLSTENIENTYQILSERNVDIDPLRKYGDHAGFTFRDCDGNVMMICEYFK
jgi:extradiol dioxygenase family protein